MKVSIIDELVTRGVENIIPNEKKLRTLLESGRRLNVYLGIDPTAIQIHIGHAVPLRKLNMFAELGHNVTFLIGDFTALIGDTSDKESERPVLTSEEIEKNFQTYKEQAKKVLDFSKIKVRHNSEWLKKLTFTDIVKLTQHFSTGDFIGRELIKRRLSAGKRVGLHELLYPVMQGYDSYFMDTDVQLGGTDQTFNMQAGRVLQKDLRNKESFIIANGFLEGTDRRKMSKSWGNAIWLTDKAEDMYGKIMSIKDDLIINYFTLATNLSMEEIETINKHLVSGQNPMMYKKRLAKQIVSELHSSKAAQRAEKHFEKTVQSGEQPESIKMIPIPPGTYTSLATVAMANFESSKSEIKRTMKQGGVEIDGKKITDPTQEVMIKSGTVIKFGKRDWRRIK